LSLAVQPPLAISTASPAPAGAVAANYSLTFAATGGNLPYTWTVDSGTLPPGLTLTPSTGLLGGLPQSSRTFSFVIRVTDSVKATVTKTYSLSIGPQAPSTVLLSEANLFFTAAIGGNAPAP